MQILERAITKVHWMAMYRYLYRKIQRNDYKAVGNTGVISFQCGQYCRAYAVTVEHGDELRPVAWLYLWQKPGWKAWEVMHVYVFEKLQGLGFARKLYKAAIDTDGKMIASGKTQSRSSRALWSSFVRDGVFDVYAIDYWDMKERAQVVWDEEFDEIFCSLEIYVPPKAKVKKHDVRLIATRKRID